MFEAVKYNCVFRLASYPTSNYLEIKNFRLRRSI